MTEDNFRPYKRADIVIDIGSSVHLEIPLELAGIKESVTVTEDAAQVETSDTKLGQVIGGAGYRIAAQRAQLYGSAGHTGRRHSDHDQQCKQQHLRWRFWLCAGGGKQQHRAVLDQ